MRPTLAIALLLTTISAHAVTLSFSASSSSVKGSTTCDWNTGLGKIRAPVGSNGFALDFGDGSDGNCTFMGGTHAADTYNCRTLNIQGNNRFTGTSKLIIRVQGKAIIGGTLNVSGFDGESPTVDSVAFTPATTHADGGEGGPSAGAGGDFDDDGVLGIASDGQGTGAGLAGISAGGGSPSDMEEGGGGGGASYGDLTGSVGEDGTGGFSPGTGGATAAAYGDESAFDTLVTLLAGSGGGAGGMGADQDDLIRSPGGGGGGGGGVVWLVAAGDITVAGNILANGGDGGGLTNRGGAGGGGGSGGTIFLQSAGHIRINGTLQASGGSGGIGGLTANGITANGGDGGNGRIRLDDIDGTITGSGTISPNAQLSPGTAGIYDVSFSTAACSAVTTALDTIGLKNTFKSFTTTSQTNGGTLTLEVQESDDGVTWSALAPLNNITTMNKRYLRMSLTLQAAIPGSLSPEFTNASVIYQIEEKSDVELTSDVSCAFIDFNSPPPPPQSGTGLAILLGFLLPLGWRKRRW